MENSSNAHDEFSEDETFSSGAPETGPAGGTGDVNTNVDVDKCREMLQRLSASQEKAALASDHTILLIAPAGTGKTNTLTTRVANLYARGVMPGRVLTCTYTIAAAEELKARLAPVMNIPLDELWIGTIHSIALRIVRAHASQLGLTGADAIVDTEQATQIMKRVLRDMGHYSVDTPDEAAMIKRTLTFVENAKAAMLDPKGARQAFEDRALPWATGISGDEIEAYRRYDTFLRLYDMLDYADMLYLATRLLENDEQVAAKWKQRFEHVLVDEYQDLSTAQIRLLRNLVEIGRTNLFCAADDDQTIYQWRGSSLESTTRFERFWPGTVVMHLSNNYRTPRQIFSHASNLIRHVADRYTKSIKTREDSDALAQVVGAPDPVGEKNMILEIMRDALDHRKIPADRIAVLCRTNRHCQEMATFLAANGVEVNLHEGLPLHTQPVGTLIAWMQMATKADNPLMFERMASYPEQLVKPEKVREVEQRVQKRNLEAQKRNAEIQQQDLSQEERELAMVKLIGPVGYMLDLDDKKRLTEGSGAKTLVDLVREVRAMLATKDAEGREVRASSPFARVGDRIGLRKAAAESNRAEDHGYARFVMLADEMVDQIGLERTLASLTSLDFNVGRSGVVVTTMHGAKGLEFDLVFAPGWEEGEFPSRQRENEGGLDEERRLAYVTITRARRHFVASWSMNRKGPSRPSRFISEMKLGEGDQA